MRILASMGERLQTVLILTGLTVLAGVVGIVLGGTPGLITALLGLAVVGWLAPRVPNAWVLRAVDARPLAPWQARQLHSARDHLAQRAGLARAPRLFLISDEKPQAFTIGERDDAVIVLSSGLLSGLPAREIVGVVAHEVMHVAHNDIRLLRFASALTNVTGALSRGALLMAFIFLPLALFGAAPFGFAALLVFMAAPWAAQVLLLALSRTREYAADAGAVRLTRDPAGLASALARIEATSRRRSWWRDPRTSLPAWTHTHPATEARIARLLGAPGGPVATSPRRPAWLDDAALRPDGGPGGRRGARRARIVVRRPPRITTLRAV